MLRREFDFPPLTPRLRALFYKPLFYRARAFDLFLPAFVFTAGLGLFLRFYLTSGDTRYFLLVFFFVLVFAMNRLAWLLTGRGKVLPKRIRYALTLLLSEPRLELLSFCIRARIPWELCVRELDDIMAETGRLGYLDYRKMELVLSDNPIVNKRCPVCAAILSDDMVVERICGLCGTAYYI